MSNNQPEVVKFLWQNGFDINLVDVRGNSPLDIAKDNGLNDIINLFPKKDIDVIGNIVRKSTITFEEAFKGLHKDEK